VSVFHAPFLTAEDLAKARIFAAGTERPQDDMTARWIRALVATVEHERAERDQALIRAEAAEAELEAYRKTERKTSA
jgi:hypothetical protein